MLVSAVLACLLAGADPLPKQIPEPKEPTTPAVPNLVVVEVKDGKVEVEVWRAEKLKRLVPTVEFGKDGKKTARLEEKESEILQPVKVPLSKVKELTITTAGGKKLTVEEAEKHIADGAVVVISADGRPVDAKFLKLFRNNVLILVSPELSQPPARRDT